MPILDWIFYEAFLKVIFREYLMNLRWKKFLLLPRSSIRYLHSPPSCGIRALYRETKERRRERKREGGRRLGERFGNLSSPPPLYRLTRPMIIIELSAVSTSSRSHGQAAPRTNAVRHLSGLEYPPFPPPPPLDNAHTRSITTLLL